MTLPHWEDYWKTGWVVSCPTGSMAGYTGEVRAGWERFFASLPDGTRLLDVGTGNGALVLIALEVARERSAQLEVHGVDLARIDPRSQVPDGERLFGDAVFHGGVDVASMPFPDGSIQAVCGQYAIEYTRREAALPEIRRVMAETARARFVLHHSASIVVRHARESLLHAAAFDEDGGTFAELREYVAAERTDAARAAALYARMTARMQHLHRLVAGSQGSTLLAGVLPALAQLFELRQRMSAEDFATAFEAARQAFAAAVRRLHDLVGAALDEDAARQLAALAAASGFSDVRLEPFWQDADRLVGWSLELQAGPRAS